MAVTLLPLLNLIAAEFHRDSGAGLVGEFNTDDAEALQRVKVLRRQEAREEFTAGLISPDEYRERAGYPPIDNAYARALYIPAGRAPVPTRNEDAETLWHCRACRRPRRQAGLRRGGPGSGRVGASRGGRADPAARRESRHGSGRRPARAAAGRRAVDAIRSSSASEPVRAPGHRCSRAAARRRGVHGRRAGRYAERADQDPDAASAGEGDRAARHAAPGRYGKAEYCRAGVAVGSGCRGGRRNRDTPHRTGRRPRRVTEGAPAHPARAPEHEHDTRAGAKALDTARAADPDRWVQEVTAAVRPHLAATLPGTDVNAAVAAAAHAAQARAEQVAAVIADSDQGGDPIEEITGRVRDGLATVPGWADAVAAAVVDAARAESPAA
ncbi:hypothetical protein ACFY4C_41615 [Actinomadura viridis]|uniref:hypothetical protein n=1 Tax=Actinomadura viridis TaxID=58110 RepID=UPI0036B16CEC